MFLGKPMPVQISSFELRFYHFLESFSHNPLSEQSQCHKEQAAQMDVYAMKTHRVITHYMLCGLFSLILLTLELAAAMTLYITVPLAIVVYYGYVTFIPNSFVDTLKSITPEFVKIVLMHIANMVKAVYAFEIVRMLFESATNLMRTFVVEPVKSLVSGANQPDTYIQMTDTLTTDQTPAVDAAKRPR